MHSMAHLSYGCATYIVRIVQQAGVLGTSIMNSIQHSGPACECSVLYKARQRHTYKVLTHELLVDVRPVQV